MRPEEDEGMNMRTCCLIFVATLVLVALIACGGYAHWRYPSPLGCSVGLVRPQKFKIDVTDFWAPHVSAAVCTTPASALRPPPSALRPPPSALRPPPSTLHPPPFTLYPRPPPSAR